jgi:hypothetical protein
MNRRQRSHAERDPSVRPSLLCDPQSGLVQFKPKPAKRDKAAKPKPSSASRKLADGHDTGDHHGDASGARTKIAGRFSRYRSVLFVYHLILFGSYVLSVVGVINSLASGGSVALYLIPLLFLYLVIVAIALLSRRELWEFHTELERQFLQAESDINTETENRLKMSIDSFDSIIEYLHKEREFNLTWGIWLTIINGWLILGASLVANVWILTHGRLETVNSMTVQGWGIASAFFVAPIVYRVIATLLDRRPKADVHAKFNWAKPVSERLIELLALLKAQRAIR